MALLFATGGGMAYVVVQQCVNAAPLARPGLVNGYLVSLFPLGAMLAAPAFGLGLDWVGVRQTLAGLAAVVGATTLAAALLVAHAGVVLTKAGRPTAFAGSRFPRQTCRPPSGSSSRVFFLAASAGLMVLSQAAGMVAAFGAGKSASLLATTGITAAIAAARLVGGWLIDRLPVPYRRGFRAGHRAARCYRADGHAIAGGGDFDLGTDRRRAMVSSRA